MPELPEVESVLQCLATASPSLIGRQVQAVNILRDSVVAGDQALLLETLTGAVCTSIVRHGKYLFFGFLPSHAAKRRWMALHLRMTGRLFLVPDHDARVRHTRLALMLDQGVALRFDDPRAFGRVWLVNDPVEVTSGLGPDALLVCRDTFLERLGRCKRQLKPLLLDQSFVAGIGNIYADEILFRAGLHPLRLSDSLTADERSSLFSALQGVLHQAVDCKGANIDGVFEAGSFPVMVYGRGGLPCSACGSVLVKERLGQRGTHYCPVCQRLV
jgi:formamidopyrimidine-DNA glycosylase